MSTISRDMVSMTISSTMISAIFILGLILSKALPSRRRGNGPEMFGATDLDAPAGHQTSSSGALRCIIIDPAKVTFHRDPFKVFAGVPDPVSSGDRLGCRHLNHETDELNSTTATVHRHADPCGRCE
jgi:hypothetical protein